MKKPVIIAIVLMMVLAVFAGCGETPASQDSQSSSSSSSQSSEAPEIVNSETVIACMMNQINHPVHRIVQMGFLEKCDELGYIGVISGLDEGSHQELVTKWESAVTNGAKGAMLWTGDDSCYEMMRELSLDCKFVVPHFAHEYADTKDFISRNICCMAGEYGRNAADFILDKLAEKGITSGVIGLTQSSANITENAAADGFRSRVLERGTGFTVDDTVFEGLEVVSATNKVTAVIQKNAQTIVGGFGTTGGSAMSWAAAMENTGRTDLVVVGVDYIEKNIALVEDGMISAIVCQPLYDEAQASVVSLDEVLHGGDFSTDQNEWRLVLDAPIAHVGGEGTSDIEYYRPIVERVIEYYTDN